MRLDYALYALAIVLFVLTAVSFVVITDENIRNLYAVFAVAAGLVFVGVGYLVRPKVKATAVQPTVSATQAIIQETVAAPESPVAEAPKTGTPIAQAPPVETVPPAIEAPKLEAPVATEMLPSPQVPAPIAEVPAPAMEEAPQIPAAALELTQIRGINEKRALQLKANGISSLRELADASASDLAAKIDVSPKIVKMWIGSAKKLAK